MEFQEYSLEYRRISFWSECAEWIALVCAALFGVLYLIEERSLSGSNGDWPFVLILVIATIFLIVGGRYANRKFFRDGMEFVVEDTSDGQAEPFSRHKALSYRMYCSRNRIFLGIIYGVFLSATPYVLGVWSSAREIQFLLAFFLFFVNFVTGNGIYTLLCFLRQASNITKFIPVSVWGPVSPEASSYLKTIVLMSSITCAYISLCMSSIIFSRFPHMIIVHGYVAFCLLLLFGTIAYPYIPLLNRYVTERRVIERRIGTKMVDITERIIESSGREDLESLYDDMRKLRELKSAVMEVDIVPFRRGVLALIAVVASILSHPLILGIALGGAKAP